VVVLESARQELEETCTNQVALDHV